MASILVIDDDSLVRESTQALLCSQGHNVTAVADGKSGIQAAAATLFDLAIVDLFMPGMDGLVVIRNLSEMQPELPIIAASGFMFGGECPPMPGFESMAAEAGAVCTLYKPLRPRAVAEAIEEALRKISPWHS